MLADGPLGDVDGEETLTPTPIDICLPTFTFSSANGAWSCVFHERQWNRR